MPFFLLDFKDSFDYLKQTWLLPLIILLLYVQFGHLVVSVINIIISYAL